MDQIEAYKSALDSIQHMSNKTQQTNDMLQILVVVETLTIIVLTVMYLTCGS